jgi:hypothetical protein
VFDGPPPELTAQRITEIYGVSESEFAEQAAAAAGAPPPSAARQPIPA